MNEELPFILVKNKRRTKKPIIPKYLKESSEFNPKRQLEIIARIQQSIEELASSDYFEAFKSALESRIEQEKPLQLICLGLGSLESYIARYQLALGILLQKHFSIGETIYFDPIFGELEKEVLKQFRCSVSRQNVEGKYAIKSDYITVFYLPHCPKQLSNNVLWRNWGEHLADIVLIANSFDSILSNTPSRLLEADYIKRVVPICDEEKLKNTFKATDVFNDLSIHTFSRARQLPEEFWAAAPEPVYEKESVELIQEA